MSSALSSYATEIRPLVSKLRDDITATVAAFWVAERTCHNTITSAWGDPVEERHHWYE